MSGTVKVCYGMITYEADIPKAKFLIKLVRPFFDEVIVVYTSDELPSDFEQFLASNNVRLVRFKWVDNFAKARNQYVYEARNLGCTYLMVSDSDEYPSRFLLIDIKNLATRWLADDITLVRLQSADVVTGYDSRIIDKYISTGYVFDTDDVASVYEYVMGTLMSSPATSPPKVPVLHVGLTAFYKPLIFRPDRGEYTWGEPHEILNIVGREVYLSYPYYYMHVKSILEIWEHAMRNIFVGGGGLNVKEKNPAWSSLRSDASSVGVTTWQQLKRYLLDQARSGKEPGWFVNRILEMSYDCNAPWASEVADTLRWLNAVFRLNLGITCSSAGTSYSTFTTIKTQSLFMDWGVAVEPDTVWSVVERYGSLDVIKQLVATPTSAFAVVARLYDVILRRAVDRSGLDAYSRLLMRTNDVKLIVSILMNSDEYNSRINNPEWRSAVLSWDGKIDYGETALPAKLMIWLKDKPSGSLLAIGCIDKAQLKELSMKHAVVVYDLTERGCGLPVPTWLYPLPSAQYDYVVVTPVMKLHALPEYVAKTALALTKPGGYLILPNPPPYLVFVVKVAEFGDEYTAFQRIKLS